MTFDNAAELYKIKRYFLDAECVIRIKVNKDCAAGGDATAPALYELSKKFGVSLEGSRELLSIAKKLGLNVIGVAFHVGSAQRDHRAYTHHIEAAKKVWNICKEMGYNLSLLDIGGGFLHEDFESAAEVVREALDCEFGDLIKKGEVEIIAEPGRFICVTAFTLVTSVIAVREEGEDESTKRMVYLADGIYSNVNAAMWPGELMTFPIPFRGKRINNLRKEDMSLSPASSAGSDSGVEMDEGELATPDEGIGMLLQGVLQEYSIWGPTCDCGDVILESAWHPEGVEIGDWFVFRNLGRKLYKLRLRKRFSEDANLKTRLQHIPSQ
ncbi:hypothetical protein ABW20_dc0104082 [Dactylellina cionopaga]|nr:hypothetical protein ABW20_dc0104082 [Dactylellina cionopaga]